MSVPVDEKEGEAARDRQLSSILANALPFFIAGYGLHVIANVRFGFPLPNAIGVLWSGLIALSVWSAWADGCREMLVVPATAIELIVCMGIAYVNHSYVTLLLPGCIGLFVVFVYYVALCAAERLPDL